MFPLMSIVVPSQCELPTYVACQEATMLAADGSTDHLVGSMMESYSRLFLDFKFGAARKRYSQSFSPLLLDIA